MARFSVVVGGSALIVTAGLAACGGGMDFPTPSPPPGEPDAAVDANAGPMPDARPDAAPPDARPDASMLGADLEIAISDAPDPVDASATLTYTIDITNHGGLDATNLKVTQRLPAGNVVFQSAIGTGWTCNAAGQIVTCTRATLLVGPGPSITVKLTTPAVGGSLTTSVQVEADTHDPDASNNDASATTLVRTPADLSIAMTDAPDPVAPQGMLGYTITVHNAGPGAAADLVVTDTLPAGVAFVSAVGTDWSCSAVGQDVTCQTATLAVSASSVIALVVTAPPSGGSISNTAQVAAATPDGNPGNNQATAGTTVNAAADLAVAIMATPDPVLGNGTLQYAIDVRNLGPDTASGITVTNQLPTGNIVFQGATGTGWTCTQVGQVVTCTRASLLVGAAPTIAITVHAPTDATVLTDTVSVASTSTDLSQGNNTATATTAVQASSDLSVSVTDAPDPVTAGASLTYAVTASNTGPSQATNVKVTSTLPPGAVFASADGGGSWTCSASGQDISCTMAMMPVGTAPRITIVADAPDVAADTTATETSRITSDAFDPVSANNTASQTTQINAPADLAIQLSASANLVPARSRLDYTIDVTNLGPRDAVNVSVTNRLPDGNITLVQNPSGNGWNCNTAGQVITCTRALLLAGAAPQISFAITTPAATGTLVDQASVSAATPDRVAGNNFATATTDVAESADLSITASADQDPVRIGTNVTYTLSVANSGPTSATSVQVTDSLPTGTALVSAGGPGWTCTAGAPVICTIASLGAASSASPITIVATAPAAAATLTSTARVSSASSDPVAGNNTAAVTIDAQPFADLSIAITDSPDPVQGTTQAGCTHNDCVTYTIDVDNAGPDPATGVAFTLTLPAQGTFMGVVGTNADWVCPAPSGRSLTCTSTHASLGLGPAPSLQLSWKAPSPGGFDILASATVSGSSHDPDATSNTATQATRVLP